MGTMSPVSSASGMNDPGGTRPRSGCSQRTSASKPSMRASAERDQRLVVQAQLVALDAAAQRGLEREAVADVLAHRLVEELDALAAVLGAVHRGVGVADEVLGRLEAVARERDADARLQEDLAVLRR